MATKLRGEVLKEGSLRLTSLPQGVCDYLLSIFELDNPVYSVTTDYQSIGGNPDKLFIKASNYDNLLEIYKNETISLNHGPEVKITYDNNGLISSTDSNNFYNIQVSPYIKKKSDIPVPIIINYNTIKDAANSEVNTISEQTWLKYIANDTYKNYDWIIQRDGIKHNCTVIPDYDSEHIQILYFTRNEIEGTSGPLGNAIMKYSGLRIKLLPYTENTYLIYKISNGGSLETREFVFGEDYNKNAYLIAAAQMSGIDTIDCKWVYTTKSDKTITVNGQDFHIENSITNVDAIFSVKDKSLTYVDGNGLINKVTFADNGSYDISKNNPDIPDTSDISNSINSFYQATVLNLKYVSSENKVYYKGHNTLEWTELLPWILIAAINNSASANGFTSVNMCAVDNEKPYIINDFKIYGDEKYNGIVLTWDLNGKKYTWLDPENIIIEEISNDVNDVYVLPFTRNDVEIAFSTSEGVIPFANFVELKQAIEQNKLIYIKHGGENSAGISLYGSAPCSVICEENSVIITFLFENIIFTLSCTVVNAIVRTRIDLGKLSNTISNITIEE